MFSRASTYFKANFNRGSDVVQVQPASSGNAVVSFEIPERPRRFSRDEGDTDREWRRTRRLIRCNDTFWEAYLNFHYKFGVSPFRLHKDGQRYSTNFCKVAKASLTLLTLFDAFVKLNTVKASINENKYISNNIELYVDWLQLISVTILRLVFMYGMAFEESNFASLLSKLQEGDVARYTHKERIGPSVKLLCMVSILISFLIAVFGLDVIHFTFLRKKGWSMHSVFLQHEYDTIMAFTRFRDWDKNATKHILNTPIRNSSDWTPLNIILGSTGTMSSFCSLMLDNSVSDLVLITSIMLMVTTKEMKLGEGNRRCRDMNMAHTQTLLNNRLKSFWILTDLSETMNDVVGHLIPILVAVDGLAVVAMINDILTENYSGTLVFAFRLIKDGVVLYVASSINNEVAKYENWFVRPHTQEILRLESNQLQTTLYDMGKQKIGIGSGTFRINDGFVANFLGLTSTYYFIVAEARGENLKH